MSPLGLGDSRGPALQGALWPPLARGPIFPFAQRTGLRGSWPQSSALSSKLHCPAQCRQLCPRPERVPQAGQPKTCSSCQLPGRGGEESPQPAGLLLGFVNGKTLRLQGSRAICIWDGLLRPGSRSQLHRCLPADQRPHQWLWTGRPCNSRRADVGPVFQSRRWLVLGPSRFLAHPLNRSPNLT